MELEKAFDLANAIASALDPEHGVAFKRAFVAALRSEAMLGDIAAEANGSARKKPGRKKGQPAENETTKTATATASMADSPQGGRAAAPEQYPDGRYSTQGAAKYLGMTVGQFNLARSAGNGPAADKESGRYVYTAAALDAFQAKRAA